MKGRDLNLIVFYRKSQGASTARLAKNVFGEGAFSYAGPFAWISLPVHVREEMDFKRFKRLLNTHTHTLLV